MAREMELNNMNHVSEERKSMKPDVTKRQIK